MKSPWRKTQPAPAAPEGNLVVEVPPGGDLNGVLAKAQRCGRTVLRMVEIREGPGKGNMRIELSTAADTFDGWPGDRRRHFEGVSTFSMPTGEP